jgi:DNA-binding MarR family transcriptional regulator
MTRHFRGKPLYSAGGFEDRVCLQLYVAQRKTVAHYRNFLAALDLTFPQYMVLVRLWEKDRVSVAGVGRELDLDSGTLTPLLKRLEAKGLIERRRSTADERVTLVTLTACGRELKAEAARRSGERALGELYGHEQLAALSHALQGEDFPGAKGGIERAF